MSRATLLFLALYAGTSTAPRASDPARRAYEAATAAGLGDSVQARLTGFLARYPSHPLARPASFELGELAYARGEYVEARAHFRRARPTGAGATGAEEARYWEGQSLFALGRVREARETVLPIARARKNVPRRWDSAWLVALSWAQEGRRPEALAAYRDLLALPAGGGEAGALYQANRLALELGQDGDARVWRNRLLGRYPRSPEAASLKADEERAAPDTTARSKRGTG